MKKSTLGKPLLKIASNAFACLLLTGAAIAEEEPEHFVNLHFSEAGTHITISGTAQGYRVEVSEDMKNWRPLGVADFAGEGHFLLIDLGAPSGERYYRVVAENDPAPIYVNAYLGQMNALEVERAILAFSTEHLQAKKEELLVLRRDLEKRIETLELRALAAPFLTQHQGNIFVIRWAGQEFEYDDQRQAMERLSELEEEHQSAEDDLDLALTELILVTEHIDRICGQLGTTQSEDDSIREQQDELAMGILLLDDQALNDSCAIRDRLQSELLTLKAEKAALETTKARITSMIEKRRAEQLRLDARTWFAVVGTERNGAVVIFDGDRMHFENQEMADQFVDDFIKLKIDEAKRRQADLDEEITDLGAELKGVCEQLEELCKTIGELEKRLEEADKGCGNEDPNTKSRRVATDLLAKEMTREIVTALKKDSKQSAAEARHRAKRFAKLAEEPIGTAVENDIWIFWAGEIHRFDQPEAAEEFIQRIKEFQELATAIAEEAAAEANAHEARAAALCDELEQLSDEIEQLKATLKQANAQRPAPQPNAPDPIAERDMLQAWLDLLNAVRDAIVDEKSDAEDEAADLQAKVHRLNEQADSPVSLIEPKDNQGPYFIVQGMGGVARIPIVPEQGESFDQALERTAQAAQELHENLKRQRDEAREEAEKCQKASDAAAQRVARLCDEVEEIDDMIDTAQQQLASAKAAAAKQLTSLLKTAADCAKCFAKKLQLGFAKLAHAGLVAKKNQLLKDAADARKDANRKAAEASTWIGMAAVTGDGKAVFGGGNHADGSRFEQVFTGPDALEQAKAAVAKAKEGRRQKKSDAKKADADAKAKEADAKKACDDVDESQDAIDKCNVELKELKKNCSIC